MWVAIAIEPTGCTLAQHYGQTYRIIGHSHGDRPQMAIAGVHHTCHLMSDQMYEEDNYTAFPIPSSQVRIEAENAQVVKPPDAQYWP